MTQPRRSSITVVDSDEAPIDWKLGGTGRRDNDHWPTAIPREASTRQYQSRAVCSLIGTSRRHGHLPAAQGLQGLLCFPVSLGVDHGQLRRGTFVRELDMIIGGVKLTLRPVPFSNSPQAFRLLTRSYIPTCKPNTSGRSESSESRKHNPPRPF